MTFTEFPQSIDAKGRVEKVKEFLKKHFPDQIFMHVDHVYNRKTGEITRDAVAEFGTQQAARKVTSSSRKFDGVCGSVKARPTITPTDKSRVWALRTAEELVRGDPALRGREVEVKKSTDRGVYVAGVAVFSQKERNDPRGFFTKEFAHLELPR